MHGSTIQVVGIEVVDTMVDIVAMVYKVDLGMPFYDLSDSSSQVLQQAHEVIDLIYFH